MEIPHLATSPPSPKIMVSETSNLQTSTADPSSTISTAWDWRALLDLSIEDEQFSFSWDSGSQTVADSLLVTDNPKSDVSDPSDRVRKRDPRMSCSNYLAGRIPCACPELDEKEDEGFDEVVGRKKARTTAATARCQVPGCEADIRELKGYHRRHRVCLRCAYATTVVLDGQQKRYCQQCGKFHILPDFDEGKRSCRRKLERHNKRRRRKSTDFKSAVEKEAHGALSPEDVSCDPEAGKELLDGVAREEDSLCLSNQIVETDTLLDSEDGHGSPFRSVPSFQNIQINSITSFVTSGETQIEGGKDNSKSGRSSSFSGNKSTYSSVCPTDRISFKLYDWNPAEFPRRLRHQIFQWLASMPVELEGYIRPGCIILTVFIAMPHLMWEKLSKDATLYISDLVNSPESLLSGRGTIHIYLNDMIFRIVKDGTSLINISLEVQIPKLHYVQPQFFEAGQPMEFIACGSNLLQPKFRFLVSFAGKYLAYDSCIVIPHGEARSCQAVEGDFTNSSDHELFKIYIPHTESKLFGPAFIEVENESGLSNFIPVLFGSKQVCSELQVMWHDVDGPLRSKGTVSHLTVVDPVSDPCEFFVSKQTTISELLLDIAWLLKEPQFESKETPLTSTKIQRFNCILKFLIQNKSVSVLERILESLKVVMEAEELNNPVNRAYGADMKLLLKNMNLANEILNQRFQNTKGLVRHSANTVLKEVPSSNHDIEMAEEDGFEPTVTSTSQESSANVTLLNKDIVMNVNHSSHLTQGFKWPQKACSNVFSATITSRRLFVFVMATLAVCFVMCISLSHPHKVREFAITVRRCMFGAGEMP